MGASRRRGRRRVTTIAVVAATTALTAALLAGCGSVNTALDCVRTADSIADGVTALQQAVENAANDPTRTDAALYSIQQNLRKIGDRTDDTDVNKAVDHLQKAVDNVRTAVRNGDSTPDVTPVTDAAGELTKVCTP
ncbi:hypothetical protein ACFY0B_30745 [Streptomyces sp. NPDC001797]|uniref:hypothetical protein n=1 Tax=Streptomyces sp. NPDC001797 TaxID=3364610 RepID=UPI0036CD48BB